MALVNASHEAVAKLPRQLLSFFRDYPPSTATAWARLPTDPKYEPRPNPFHSTRNKYTKKHNEPRYSIRRAQELYNIATEHNLQHLLPPRMEHKEGKIGNVMKGLTRWKGSRSERSKDAREEAIKVKTVAARKVVRVRKNNTKAKKRRQRTGLITN